MSTDRTESVPFDIVLNGKVADLDHAQLQDKLLPLIERLWDATEQVAVERIHRGPLSREL
jgi:hypothetical protein